MFFNSNIKKVQPANHDQVGEIVTYRTPQGTVVTHRVTGITAGPELSFQTKGDASSAV